MPWSWGAPIMPGCKTGFRIVRVGERYRTLTPGRCGSPSAAIAAFGSLTARATSSLTRLGGELCASASWHSAINRSRSSITSPQALPAHNKEVGLSEQKPWAKDVLPFAPRRTALLTPAARDMPLADHLEMA